MADVTKYLDLITSEHQDKPKFTSTISLDTSILARIQDVLSSMIPIFDVESAVGEQLDFIGKWVGVSRSVPIPVSGVYFSWDSVSGNQGWEYGIWQPHDQPSNISVLPDDVYRTLIRQKIAANQWDGTIEGAYAIWESIFPTITILINDKQNMSYDLALVGGLIDSLTLALLTGGDIPLRPEGVKINTYFIPIDSGPLFGWDVDSSFVTGWDDGSWAQEFSAS